MDWLAWMPYIVASIVAAVIAFLVLNYIRVKKLPPTDEAVVGEYRILIDVGRHIVSFQGTLYYFTKLLNPKHLAAYEESLEKQAEEKLNFADLKKFLEEKAYYYAMRIGRQKIAFISKDHPIEITPFFKTEEGSATKLVLGTGSIGRETKGFQHVTFEPLDLSKHTLNPADYKALMHCGQFVIDLSEKVPLIEEINAEKEKNRVLQAKVTGLGEDVGKLKDAVEYWKHIARKKAVEPHEEEPGRSAIPGLIRAYLPYALLFVAGYIVSPLIPQLAGQHPALLGAAVAVVALFLRKVVMKR